ncbi:MAG: hypothetical protein AAF696_34950 [Bacteroidota bacterium]
MLNVLKFGSSVLILLSFFLPSELFSQACCSGGVPISSNLGLGASSAGTLQLQLTYDQNTLRDLLASSERLDDDRRTRNTISLILESSYDINEALSVSALLSVVRQERIILTQSNTEDVTVNNGIGDGIILLRYNFLHGAKHPEVDFLLGAGPKFPFGPANFTDDRGITLPADLQPGTGAWDAIFWTNFSRRALFRDNLSFNLTATYRLTGTNPVYNGSLAYKFGNEFQVQWGFQDRFLLGSLVVDPIIAFQYRTVAADRIDGSIFENTGGHWVNLRPGLNINIGQYSALRFTGSLPLYRYLQGTQLSTTYRFAITFYQSLELKKRNNYPFQNLAK